MSLETKVSEILENILGLLSLEGSFEVDETEQGVMVSIDTEDAGRLIGRMGETLNALQLLVNQILSRQLEKETSEPVAFKRVIVDVADWKKQREDDLVSQAKNMADQVKTEGKEIALEPMPSWQRRVIHMALEEIDGVYSESVGEGEDRHLVIKPGKGPEESAVGSESRLNRDQPAAVETAPEEEKVDKPKKAKSSPKKSPVS